LQRATRQNRCLGSPNDTPCDPEARHILYFCAQHRALKARMPRVQLGACQRYLGDPGKCVSCFTYRAIFCYVDNGQGKYAVSSIEDRTASLADRLLHMHVITGSFGAVSRCSARQGQVPTIARLSRFYKKAEGYAPIGAAGLHAKAVQHRLNPVRRHLEHRSTLSAPPVWVVPYRSPALSMIREHAQARG
jgi:hypothetical protein